MYDPERHPSVLKKPSRPTSKYVSSRRPRDVLFTPRFTRDVPSWIGHVFVRLFAITPAYRRDRRLRRQKERLGGPSGLVGAIQKWIPIKLRTPETSYIKRAPISFEQPSVKSYVIAIVSSFLRRKAHAGQGVCRLISERWPASFYCLQEPSIIRRF